MSRAFEANGPTYGDQTLYRSSRLPNLIAFDDCGIELRCPNLVTRRKRKIDKDDPGATHRSDTLRYVAWDPEVVVASYGGLNAGASHDLGVTFIGDDQFRVQSIEVNGLRVDGPRTVAPYEVAHIVVPFELGSDTDTAEVRIVREGGPDAAVSRLAIWSDSPAPLIVTVVGDSSGGLFGTVSDVEFQPVIDAEVVISCAEIELVLRSDADGAFEAPIRELVGEGRRSDVRVMARSDDRVGSITVDSTSLSLGLTDIPSADRIDLAGPWTFRSGRHPQLDDGDMDTSAGATAQVPGHLVYDGLVADDGVATLARRWDLPPHWSSGRIFVRFDGAYGLAEVFLNGSPVGAHHGGATSFDIEVTSAARPGPNVLSVVLTEFTPCSVIDYMSWYAHMSLAGIWRSVTGFHTPHINLGAVTIGADVSESGDGRLTATIPVASGLDTDHAFELSWTLRDEGDQLIAGSDIPVKRNIAPRSRQSVEIDVKIPKIVAWTAEAPTLYRLAFELKGDGRMNVTHDIGFRQVLVVGNSILINGAPVRLLGCNRHDSRRDRGRALTREDMHSDLETFRHANINTIRTSHYPPAPALLDICDSMGMYVLDQPPICWAGTYKWDMSHVDAHTLPYLWQLVAETFERDRNHPSVIVWDIANESAWGRNFEVCRRKLRERDPFRPVLFSFDEALQDPLGPLHGEGGPNAPDIRSSHYPGWFQPWESDVARFAQLDEPLLADEFMPIFQVCQREPHEAYALRVDPGLRDYWVTGYRPFLAKFLETRSCVGGMVWSGVDDVFEIPTKDWIGYGAWSHLPEHEFLQPYEFFEPKSGSIRGDGEWGLLDSWGRPRPELWHLQKMYSPLLIVAEEWIDEESLRLIIRNRFAHTPLSAVQAKLVGGGSQTSVTMTARPGDDEEIVLDMGRLFDSDPASRVTLEVFHPEGWLIDAWSWGRPGHTPPRLRDGDLAPVLIDVAVGTDGSLDVATGAVTAWPTLHVMDANDGSTATVAVVQVRSVQDHETGVIGQAIAGGDGWSGTTTLAISSDREALILAYDFMYEGPPRLAREVGLAIPVATELQTLWWDRHSEWSYYPETHIGRPIGVAAARPGGATSGHAGQPWELDTGPAGSNDFRSTKRMVRAAGLRGRGREVVVVSDGDQHVRASIEDGRPVLRVLDWYGGVRTDDSEDGVWTAYLGRGMSIETGVRVHGKVTLKIRRTGPHGA